jgi:hypothetical protein
MHKIGGHLPGEWTGYCHRGFVAGQHDKETGNIHVPSETDIFGRPGQDIWKEFHESLTHRYG